MSIAKDKVCKRCGKKIAEELGGALIIRRLDMHLYIDIPQGEASIQCYRFDDMRRQICGTWNHLVAGLDNDRENVLALD